MTGNGRRVSVGIVALGLFGTMGLAQSSGIADAKARQDAADQRAKVAAAQTLLDAERLARTNPTRAVQLLKNAKADIASANAIGTPTRDAISILYQAQINALEGRPAEKLAPKLDPRSTAVREGLAVTREKALEESRQVADGLERIQYYRTRGNARDADDVAQRLAAAYPDNPAIIFLGQRDGFAANIADARAMSDLMNKRWTVTMNSVQRSGIPPAGDIEFPADWKEKTERRKKLNELKVTPKEKSIIEALDKAVSISVIGRPLQEVLQDLSTQMNESILVDPKSLADLGIDLNKPVTLQAKGLSARTVLRQVLGGAGLTFVMKDEAIQVVTVERARDMLVTRVYYLGDIVQGVGPFGGAPRWGPLLDTEQTLANVKHIMDSIQASIDPLSWRGGGGGPGSITFHYPSMSLIVRASTEVHASLGNSLPGRGTK